ncbi:MAG TPA: condensation domain-containing protein, partial [Alphaproteobacteria bacterium]|nr:condensation domain-containing protein [Alphaproteobacteria bacterium]
MIWIENSIQPNVPLNHVTVLGTIRGNIQPETFEQAFAELVTRHEALRAKVIDTTNGPRYCVPEEHVGQISLVDLSGEPDPSSAYQRWIENRCRKILEFDQRLYDAALIRVREEEFVFFLNQNHIISDGSSTLLLFRELGEIYLQILSGHQRETPLAEVHPYSEFIRETSKYTTSEQSAKSRAFWSERFSSSLPFVSYYGRNAANSKLLTTRITRRLGADLSRAVHDMGRLKPPFIVFITVLIAYLRRVTLNDDICIGVPFHNRTPTFADTVGLLMEVVPYLISVDSEDTLDSLLRKVRNETRAIKEHRRHTISARLAPYDVILNYRPESLATFAGFPLTYDVTNPLNLIGSGQSCGGHSVRREGHESLRVEIKHTDDDEIFRVTFDFDVGIWPDAAERERAADHFLTLIAA